MLNIATRGSTIISYNNINNINALTTSYHFHRTDGERTDRQKDQKTDIATYIAPIAARNMNLQ